MSENQANPGSEGMNVQPPVVGQSPQSGAEVGSQTPWQPVYEPSASSVPPPSSPYQAPAGYDPSAHWMRPAPDPARDDVPSAAQAPDSTGQTPTYPAQAPTYGQSGTPYGQSGTPYDQSGTPYDQSGTAYSSPASGYPSSAGYSSSSGYPSASPASGQTTWTGVPVGSTVPAPAVKKPNGAVRAVVAVVAAGAIALTAGGVGGFVGYALHGDSGSPVQSTANSDPKNVAPAIDRSTLATIAKGMQPAVVSVKTSVGEGSGVVISADGYIVTNNHVVADATGSTVQVTFTSGKNLTAKIIGADPKTDIAVVKTDSTGLSYAEFADSDAVQVGDTVLAIGSPLGLQGSVTAGIISALHRTITVGGEQQSQFQAPAATTTIGDAIQTDAPINPGNSGGALVNTNGKVIGINSAIATSGSNGNIGVGFAISSNKAKSVSDQLIKGGKVSHPYLGISLGEAQNGGAQVQSVAAGSPAASAGIQEGDVITKVDDRTITNSEDLVGAIQSSSPGTKLTLTVVRNGSERTVTATVGDQP